jgi:hypothetical protein
VILRRGDDFPALTAAIEKSIPPAQRATTRPAALVRNQPTTAWAMAAPGQAYLVYSMEGEPVNLDLAGDRGDFAVAWLEAAGELKAAAPHVTAGKVVTLTPPATEGKRPWVGWLTRR